MKGRVTHEQDENRVSHPSKSTPPPWRAIRTERFGDTSRRYIKLMGIQARFLANLARAGIWFGR